MGLTLLLLGILFGLTLPILMRKKREGDSVLKGASTAFEYIQEIFGRLTAMVFQLLSHPGILIVIIVLILVLFV